MFNRVQKIRLWAASWRNNARVVYRMLKDGVDIEDSDGLGTDTSTNGSRLRGEEVVQRNAQRAIRVAQHGNPVDTYHSRWSTTQY